MCHEDTVAARIPCCVLFPESLRGLFAMLCTTLPTTLAMVASDYTTAETRSVTDDWSVWGSKEYFNSSNLFSHHLTLPVLAMEHTMQTRSIPCQLLLFPSYLEWCAVSDLTLFKSSLILILKSEIWLKSDTTLQPSSHGWLGRSLSAFSVDLLSVKPQVNSFSEILI